MGIRVPVQDQHPVYIYIVRDVKKKKKGIRKSRYILFHINCIFRLPFSPRKTSGRAAIHLRKEG